MNRPAPMTAAIAAACIAAFGSGAAAQDAALTGSQVLDRCQSTQAAEVSWCVGFTFGVAMVIADPTTDAKYRACFPADFTSEAARLVVARAIETEPALLDLAGSHAVWYALRKAFECPK